MGTTMEYGEILCVVLLGALIQFVAAILGPKMLNFASILLILAAAGAAAYLVHLALNAQFAGIGADAQALAINFGTIAALFVVGHYFMRWLFRCMARCSHA